MFSHVCFYCVSVVFSVPLSVSTYLLLHCIVRIEKNILNVLAVLCCACRLASELFLVFACSSFEYTFPRRVPGRAPAAASAFCVAYLNPEKSRLIVDGDKHMKTCDKNHVANFFHLDKHWMGKGLSNRIDYSNGSDL